MGSQKTFRRRIPGTHNLSRTSHDARVNAPFFDFGKGSGFFSTGTGEAALNRENKPDEKENENGKLQRSDLTSSSQIAPANVQSYVSSLNSGSSLPRQSRQFFEPVLGRDLSKVMIHNDRKSAEMAESINAKAFTYKNHIVFNNGEYDPDTEKGKRLLSHELTHVTQQDNSVKRAETEHEEEEKIQRAPAAHSDFVIQGVYPGARFVPDTIYFDFASAEIPSTEEWKLQNLAQPPEKDLILTGLVSEEGDTAFNSRLLKRRMNRVGKALKDKGLEKDPKPNPQQAAGAGQMDYRQQRAVEVIPRPDDIPPGGIPPSHTPDCSTGSFDVTPCENSFNSSYSNAMAWLSKAKNELSSSSPEAVSRIPVLFPGKTISDILPHIVNLNAVMLALPANHECHSSCDAGCSRPAYHNPSGRIVLCPDFTSSGNDFQSYLLIHESLHGTPGLHTVDTAYSFTRLILSLTGDQAMQNTDSYVLLILRLGGASTTDYTPPRDTFPGLNSDEEKKAYDSINYLEQWLDKCEFDTSLLYDGIKRNTGNAGGWQAADEWHAALIHEISPFFGLTDPGTSSPFLIPPVNSDRWIMAGAYDRYTMMKNAIYRLPVTFTKAVSGAGQWSPGPGNSVSLGVSFFDPALTLTARIKYLFRLMIESVPDQIPSSRKNDYISVTDSIRTNRGVGP